MWWYRATSVPLQCLWQWEHLLEKPVYSSYSLSHAYTFSSTLSTRTLSIIYWRLATMVVQWLLIFMEPVSVSLLNISSLQQKPLNREKLKVLNQLLKRIRFLSNLTIFQILLQWLAPCSFSATTPHSIVELDMDHNKWELSLPLIWLFHAVSSQLSSYQEFAEKTKWIWVSFSMHQLSAELLWDVMLK